MRIFYLNSPYFDYLTATLVEGLLGLGCEVRASEASNYAVKIADEDVAAYAEAADLIIVGSNAGVRYDLVARVRNPRVVWVDGGDYQVLVPPPGIQLKMIFKRELVRVQPDPAAAHVFPLPFAAERRYFAEVPVIKDVLVSFLANIIGGNPMRYSIHQRLVNRRDPRLVSGMTGERAYVNPPLPLPIATPVYHAFLHRSLISVNVPGTGYDCARYWEILAAGAMLFTYELDIVIPEPFTDGVDCVTFRSLEEFESKLDYYVRNVDRAGEIARLGHQRLLAHHTTQARAAYFLDIVRRHVDRPGACAPDPFNATS